MSRRLEDRRARSGFSILLVLVCMIVITSLVGAMLRNLVLVNRQSKQTMHALQAAWLAESGLERAVHSLEHDAEYRGETWNVTDDQFGTQTGHVEIQLHEAAEDEDFVTVHVMATFPYGATFAVKARREARIGISKPATTDTESNTGDDLDATQ